MPFTREELAAYEASTPAPVVETKPAPVAKEPEPSKSGEVKPDAEVEPSTTEESTDQTESGDVSSDEEADSSTATGEADTETETEDAGGEAVEPTPPPKRGTAAARIADLIEENKSLRAFGEHVLSRLKTEPAAAADTDTTKTTAPAVTVDEPEPTLESCGFDAEKFSKATIAYAKKVARAEARAEFTAQSEFQTAEIAKREFAIAAEEFGKTKPDWEVVMSNRQLPGMHEDAAKEIVTDKAMGPAIAYHLAKHPDQATRLARMTRDQQLVRIGELRASLKTPTTTAPTQQKPVPKVKKPTQAPTPPTPTTSGSATAKPNMLDTSLNMNDWVARDRAEKAAARANAIKMRDSMRRK
jgi:hypothetical protein